MSVFNTSVTTVFLAPYLTSIAESAADADGRIHPLGISVPAGSYFGYVLSLSVVLQVLVLPLTGAIADRSGRKRQLLAGFATLGSLGTMAMFFVADERYLLGALLFVVANLCFGAATVVYYSWLPDLAGPDERDAVSSRGWAIGYLGGALLLAANLALFTGYEGLGLTEGEAVRICLASAGVWWAGFTVVSVTLLRNRRPRDVEPAAAGRSAGALAGGFRQLGATLRDMRRYRLTLWFLAAYLLFNDGVQTIIGVSAQYGKEQLELSQTTLVSAILLVQVVAFVGALTLGRIAARIGAKRTVLGALVVWTGVLVAAYFLQAGAAVQFYGLAAVIGFVLGGTQALSRSLFSQLIPPGKEAEYFGFYEISDRGTSWLGPFLFALTYQLTESYRYAIFSLIFFFVVGGFLLAKLNMRQAIVEAGNTPPERL
jgi:UMF1 family MFS transporter